jgi:amino acid adenylation domain-containing protein
MFGHRPDFVAEAIRRQLDEGFEIGPQSPIAGEIAKTFCQITGSERMTFCNTGSEAVMAAIRVARTVTGRNKIALFSGAYHGLTDEVLVKGLTTRTGEHQSIPVAPGIPREKVSNVTVLEYGAPGSLEWIRQNAKSLAAVLVEPVQSRHPGLQPVEFLKEVRRITEDNGTAFIFDEVVTGFRVHPAGCQALFGIKADLATYGKVVAGGMPIGILAGKAEYMDTLDGGSWQFGDDSVPEVGVTFFAGTFVRHPLTLAAVKSVLQHLMEEGPALQDRITEKTARLVKAINTLFAEKSVPSRVETFGSIFYFSFPTEERFAGLFYHFLRLRGVHLREGFPCFITTAHSDEDIDRIFTAFKQSVDDMQRAGFFPAAPVTLGAASGSVTASHDAAQAPREVPVTESQLEVWLSDQLGDDASCGYNESISISMRGVLNEQAISGAIQQVVARHEALRSTFSEDGEFVRFAPALEVKIASKDFSHLDRAQREAQVAQIVHEDAHTPFRLSEGPLVRAQLIRLEPELTLLIFTAHHIVCDGWSTNVLLDDLARLYNAFRAGVPAQLDAPVQFGTYASHQREFIASLQGKQVEQYWLQQFQTPVSPLGLPTDRPRPPVREFKGATHRRKIGAALYSDVRKLGAKHKCTLFVTLLSAFQILMKRLSGQDDIVVGVPMAGQSLLDDAALVGHCVNFIPIRAHVDGTQKVPEFLAQLRQTVLAAYENQNYTYGRLVRKLSLQRDPSRLPLVEVQFNLERVGDGIQFDGLETQIDANPKSFVNFDLFWNVIESSEGLVLDCDYNTGLFDEATIDRWLSHYESLLAEIAANAERPIAEIPLLNENDLRRWMPGWNETATEYPRELCVHELFEAQVKRSPDAVAVQCDQRELTYAELNRRADQLAGYLQGLGVEPGVLVGLFVDRSLEMMVGLLGILKAGAAYVPIDPTFPPERISFVLADAEASVLLTQERLPGEFVNPDARVVFLDRDWELIRQASPLVGTGAASPKDLAYVIYTSGSTGKPKGVEIPHQAFVNLLCSMQRKPGLEPSDVLLAVTTLSFDIAGLELFLPLCVGAKLVIATREDVVDGHKLLSRLRTSGANVIQATPVTFRLLIEAGWEGIPRVKVLCGGEALPRELAGQLGGLSAAVWNMYGPTETTIWSSTVQVQNDEGPVPIGPPIDNTQFYVLDQAGQLTPIGVPGELHIGGDGLARGYFRRPELTAEKFISSPFGANQNTRLYKTGDLVRCLPSGTFEFLGRLDHQVKLRGFRIELGEIETALARYPGVRQAVVTLREDVSGDKRLVAYVTTDQKTFTVTEARDFLNGKLPYYMMPAAIVRMETMPLTPNGKVDRRALPAPEGASPSRAQSYVAPRNEEETALAGIWEEVLRQERISVQDSLFELGADSLHIFQIVARANKAGMKVTPAHLLKHRTIAALSEALKAENALPGTKEAPALVRVAREKYKVKH